MQCIAEELGQRGVETVDPAFVPVVFRGDAAKSDQLCAMLEAHGVPAVVSNRNDDTSAETWDDVTSDELPLSGVTSADQQESLVIDGSDDEGDDYFEEEDDDEEFEDDFDDLDDLDDDYEDEEEEEDEELEPDLSLNPIWKIWDHLARPC